MAKGGFPGGYGGGGKVNMNMIKQAQKMQADMLKMQAEVEAQEFSASAGGGMVTVTVNGKHQLTSVKIDEDAVIEASAADDVEMLCDAVVAAANEALKKADEAMSQNMSKITGGLNFGF